LRDQTGKNKTIPRSFLKRNGRAVGLALAAPAIARSDVIAYAGTPGANGSITLGLIGSGGCGARG